MASPPLDLVWLVEGRVDAVIVIANKPWDTAAGVTIAHEVGAHVVDQHGRAHTSGSDSAIAANPALLPKLIKLVA